MKKFSIRDLFFVVTLVAVLCGWWLDRQQQRTWWAEQLESANQQVQKLDRQLRVHRDEEGSVRIYRIVRGGRALTMSLK